MSRDPSSGPWERTVVVKTRARSLGVLGAVTPLGFATKFYSGPGATWVAWEAGGLLYVIFWIFAVLAAFPRLSRAKVSVGVVVATCILEFVQLWHPTWLERIRATFLGQALLGETFAWSDFPYYFAGGLAAYALAGLLGCGRAAPGRATPHSA
jgi:hypothetical protein